MSRGVDIDVFGEDTAHEAIVKPMVLRCAAVMSMAVSIEIRSARGGHPRLASELRTYQRLIELEAIRTPDILVVAVDANERGFAMTKKYIKEHIASTLVPRLVVACADPHVERWYLTDSTAFQSAVGGSVPSLRIKNERHAYKRLLAKAVVDAGHPPTLGGIEFAQEIVGAMDFYRAGRRDHSLRDFIASLEAYFRGVVA